MPHGAERGAVDAAALRLARETLQHALGRGPEPNVPAGLDAKLVDAKLGLFVTLHVGGQLRGCIGVTEARTPFSDTIAELTRAAAFEDPRFEPLAPEELDELDIELSILSGPEALPSDPDALVRAVRIGEHGLMVSGGPGRRGLLLPQVATEHAMDAAEFLGATCRKAGLPPDAWRTMPQRLRWESFTTRIVRETDAGGAPPRDGDDQSQRGGPSMGVPPET